MLAQDMDSGCSHWSEEKNMRILSDLNIVVLPIDEKILKKEEV
jgi:hypothetical protein